VELVFVLLAAGAQVDFQDEVSCVSLRIDLSSLGWCTSLHRACSGGHVEVVTLLLSAGASIEVQTKVRRDEGSTRVVFISFVFRMERLLFTLLVMALL
jgi:ankyrin repeat protein